MINSVDNSLTVLKAAALNAQHAALRYQFQTTGLREARTARSKDHSESSPSPSGIRHTISNTFGVRPGRGDNAIASNNSNDGPSVNPIEFAQQPADVDRSTNIITFGGDFHNMEGYHDSRPGDKESGQRLNNSGLETAHHSESLLPSDSHSEDLEFAKFFKETVYPFLQASVDFYGKDLSKDELFSISMELSNDAFVSKFRHLVRQSSYTLDNAQKIKLKKYIYEYFGRRAGHTQVIDLTSPDQEENFSIIPSNGTATVSSNGAISDPNRLASSRRSTQMNSSDDISLLGPGQMPLSTHHSHSNRVSDDLSLLGPGETHRTIDVLSKPAAKGRLFPAEKSHQRNALRSHQRGRTPETLNRSCSQLRPALREGESSSEDSDNVLDSWLSPLKQPSNSTLGLSSKSASKGSNSLLQQVESMSEASTVLSRRASNAIKISEPKPASWLKSVEKGDEDDDDLPTKRRSSSSNTSESKPSSMAKSAVKHWKSSGSKSQLSMTSARRGSRISSRFEEPKALASTTSARQRKAQQVNLVRPRTQQSNHMSHGLPRNSNVELPGVQAHALRAVIVCGKHTFTSDHSLKQKVAALGAGFHRPYISPGQDTIDPSDMHGTLKHVDFSDEECEALFKAALALLNPRELSIQAEETVSVRLQLKEMIQEASHSQVAELIQRTQADPKNILLSREAGAIRDFLADLGNGHVPDRPGFVRVKVAVVDPLSNPRHSTASLLRSRELGVDTTAGRHVQSEVRLRASETILPWRRWKGASGDIVTCAWAPNSRTFACGAAAPSNNEDLQYNRPRNLLIGDLQSNLINELPDHRVDRPRPEMIPNGPNADQAMYNSLDPMIYTTISSLQFSRHGSRLFTASHDKTAKIWSVSESGTAYCSRTLYHDAIVTDLDVSKYHDGLFATASMAINNSIRVYDSESESVTSDYSSFSSPRAQMKPKLELYPECLRWGKTPNTSNLLLAGFQQWAGEGVRDGDICLWDVSKEESLNIAPSKLSAFTATWHPLFDIFAVGGAPPPGTKMTHPNTRSVVRTWDVRTPKRFAMEFECPALDMQDLTFHPVHPEIVTAGCTDSATYVWDFRKPIDFLVKLQHDRPIMDWDHTRSQEEADAGVMMTLWGLGGSRFYTGSSDGIIKCWDPFRSPEDALIRNIADVGASVQSGAFSPDFGHLLVGDADGGVHVLTSAPVDRWEASADYIGNFNGGAQEMKLIEASNPNGPRQDEEDPGNEGILAARKLLKSKQLVLDRAYGVGKGPNYAGPYAMYARMEGVDPETTRFLPEFDAMQAFSRHGNKRPENVRRIKGVIKGRKQIIADAQKQTDASITTKVIQGEGRSQKPAVPERNYKKRALSNGERSPTPSKKVKTEIVDLTDFPPNQSRSQPIEVISDPEDPVEDNIIPDSEYLEENYWWPRMDEEILDRLLKC